MNSEKLQLNGKNFTEDISKALRLMRHDKDFTDVTLVCEDDILVRAHRVILASASSFFKSALMRKKVVRQRKLYLRGLTAFEVETALDFLYMGEVSVVSSFIRVAQDLGLRGFERPRDEYEGNVEVPRVVEEVTEVDLNEDDQWNDCEGDSKEVNAFKLKARVKMAHNAIATQHAITVAHQLPLKKFVETETFKVADEISIGEKECTLNTSPDLQENSKCGSLESIPETCKSKEAAVFNDNIEKLLGEEDIIDVSLSENSERNADQREPGIPREDAVECAPPTASVPVKKRNRKEMRATLKTSLSNPGKEVKDDISMVEVKSCEPENNVEGAVSTEQLDSQIMSLMARREGMWSCNLCGKEKRERSCLSRHIEGVHISGYQHPCNLCQRILTSRASLGAHKRKFHRAQIGLNL